MELVEWLTAILDEDERVALAAMSPADWHRSGKSEPGVWTVDCSHWRMPAAERPPSHDLCCRVGGDITIYDEGGHTSEQARHIALHDPAAVLADIAAKRAIIALHKETDNNDCILCGWDDGYAEEPVIHDAHPCPTLRALASAYAHREGYSQSWA